MDTENGFLTSRSPLFRIVESLIRAVRVYLRIRHGNYDLIYCRESWLDPFRGLLLRSIPIPSIIEVNGLLLRELELDGARAWLRWLVKCTQASNLRSATGVVAACKAWAGVLRRDYALSNIDVIQNGVDLAMFRPDVTTGWRARFGLDEKAIILGFVGSLGRYYDFKPFFECIREMSRESPELRMVIVGGGPRRDDLADLVKEFGVEDLVQFHGPVPHEEVPAVIQAFDLALLPASCTRVHDTGGVLAAMKLAEYCAAGKPIVLVDYPGSDSYSLLQPFSWAVVPSEFGYLDCLRLALTQRDRWPEMGLAAREFAENYLSWDASVVKLESLLAQWLKPNGLGLNVTDV